MNKDKYVFAQLVAFLDNNKFRHLVDKYDGNRYVKNFTCWNQLMALMFGQLCNRESLRDVVVALETHQSKCYHLGMGRNPIAKTTFATRNSTSNHNYPRAAVKDGRVVSYRNSTSNHNRAKRKTNTGPVVSYRNSTSNHNLPLYSYWVQQVVSYRNSTSNHNTITASKDGYPLYLIEILHQTTTKVFFIHLHRQLYLIEILHQTTTKTAGCFISGWLYLIEILHQTTTAPRGS